MEVSPRFFNECFCSWRKCDKVTVGCRWWATQLGVYSKYITLASPLAAPCFLLPSGISHQMGRELITNQEGRTDANTHSSRPLNPFITLLLPKLPAASGENLGHSTLQTPWPLTNTSLFTKVMTKPSKTFFASSQLSDLLSQQHNFSNEIVSQREE